MNTIKFGVSNICSAFAGQTIGTKVLDAEAFMITLSAAVETYDVSGDRVPGQHFVVLPEAARPLVSAGVGRRTTDPADYVLRVHRDRVEAYLRRDKAAEVEGVAVVVYTTAAYLADPDVLADPAEAERIRQSECSHVIVAVLAFAGPKAPLSPYRLVHNLAGGNREAAEWSADEIRGKAAESTAYWNEWETVAD